VSIVAADMGRDLQLNELQLGMVFSAFAAGYAIFQLPGGLLGAYRGSRLVLTVCCIGWGLITVLVALVPGTELLSSGAILGSLVVLRFLMGAFNAPLFPCACGGAIAAWFPKGSWGLPNGLTSTGLTLGAAATAPIVVWLLAQFGWRGALLVTAPLAFIIAAVWWWFMRDDPKDHPLVTAGELALIDAGRDEHEDDEVPGAWKLVLTNRDILLLTLSYFCMNYIFYLFFNWLFYYLTEIRGLSGGEAGFLTAALWILGAVGATAGGLACDRMIARFGFRRGPLIVCVGGLVLSGLCLAAGAMSADAYVMVTLFCLSFAFNQLTEASFWSASISIGGRYAAAAGGVLNTGGNVVGFVGGMMVPAVANVWGWDVAVATGALFAFIGAVLWLFIRADRPMIVLRTTSARVQEAGRQPV